MAQMTPNPTPDAASRFAAVRRLASVVLRSPAARGVGGPAVALAGAWIGLTVAGAVNAPIGPAQTRLSVAWNNHGDVDVRIPPLGSIELDTHDGPLAVDVDVRRLDPDEAKAIVDDPTKLNALPAQAAHDVRNALI